ncbi:The GLUG motif-containing protein [Halorubrum aquaticum]|uniref:The GLUG motif-containing protein n=1 Tax=Halorubrum aquaticum TaxID=387340 RepID=A0A1I3CKX6_9EURY|nr:The GLUG motif-containing protein [Halorubrum aquaticum]
MGLLAGGVGTGTAQSSPFGGGTGSSADPYLIETVTHLGNVSEELDAHYQLTTDIDLAGTGTFEPIGTGRPPFTGSFDGGGHTIRGLRVDRPDSEDVGLFSTIEDALIERLRLLDGHLVGDTAVGGLVGRSTGGTVSGCSITGTVDGSFDLGGLVGVNDGGTIEDSYAVIDEIGTFSGGIAGINDGEIARTYAVIPIEGEIKNGISFQRDGSTEDSYWDSAVAQEPEVWEPTGVPTPRMTSSNARTYLSGLDFDETWETTDGYPKLAWENGSPPSPEPTAAFVVTERTPGEIELDSGEPLTVSATIENVGSETAERDVELHFDGAVDGPGSAGRQDDLSIELTPDQSTSIEFDPIETDALVDGEYAYDVRTGHDRSGSTMTLGSGGTDGDVWIEGPREVPAEEGATISGGTELPDDATFEVRARSTEETYPQFIYMTETSPEDGEWTAELDFSSTSPDDEFRLTVTHRGETHVESRWTVIDPLALLEVDRVVLSDPDSGDRLIALEDDRWESERRSLPSIRRDQTASIAVTVLDDGESVPIGDDLNIHVESGDAFRAVADGDEIELTGVEAGTSGLTVSVIYQQEVRYRSPPVLVTVTDDETDSDDGTAGDETDSDDGTADDDSPDGSVGEDGTERETENETNSGADDDTDGEGIEDDRPESEPDGIEVPGFTVSGTVATISGAVYALSRRIGRSDDEGGEE